MVAARRKRKGRPASPTKRTATTPSAADFGASFMGFMERMSSVAPSKQSDIQTRIETHFGQAATRYPVVKEKFAAYDHANLHRAIERYVDGGGRSSELIGICIPHEGFGGQLGLAQLLAPPKGPLEGVSVGPVAYSNVDLGDDGVVACVRSGLFLVRDQSGPVVMYLRGPSEMGWRNDFSLEVMSPERQGAEGVLRELRTTMRERNVYRGRIISLEANRREEIQVRFHRLPAVDRSDIILPAGVLERIERHALRFTENAERLRAAGRHLKRGLLLHGPPGTGKTLTAMHLAGRMSSRTILLVTGRDQALVQASCRMARALQPATVILEDVDLIAEERTRSGSVGCHALLFELLNEMDGLAEDADVLFLLTTNRPEILEPALASRPGRVDTAVEIPLPDDESRHQLLDLYGRGLDLQLSNPQRIIERTRGASAAFMRELLRTAALCAADGAPGPLHVTDEHLERAIHELVVAGGDLTASLLGARLQQRG